MQDPLQPGVLGHLSYSPPHTQVAENLLSAAPVQHSVSGVQAKSFANTHKMASNFCVRLNISMSG